MPASSFPPYRLSLLAILLAGLPLAAPAAEPDQPEPPTHIQSDEASAREGDFAEARGEVIVTRDNLTVESDWARYTVPDDRLRAGDKVTVHKDGDVLTGTQLDMTIGARKGDLLDPAYHMAQNAARGDAVKLIFDGPDRYTIKQGRMTTCAPGNDSWYLNSSTIDLDYKTNVGEAWNGWVEFKGAPIFYYPWIDFPLDSSRKSGLLAPSIGMSSKNGVQYQQPYYINIAPNRDATLSPHYMSKQGLMLGGEFRYLEPDYSGLIRYETLDDRIEDKSRNSLMFRHGQKLSDRLRLDVNVQKTSDEDYFSDFGDRLEVSSQSNLPREGVLSYTGDNWNGFVRWQRYQTLSTLYHPVAKPYDRMPQLAFTAQPALAQGLETTIQGELTEFNHSTQTDGTRTWVYPSVSVPFNQSWGFITPKIGVHATNYRLRPDNGDDQNHSRTLPIASLDAGLFFEREAQIGGRNMVQTLEPRLFYLYVPYRDQSHLPTFDSGETDLSFTQLFSENQYSGQDRINDANQLTTAVTSRLFEDDNGIERFSATVGQRHYFSNQRVTLSSPGRPDSDRTSDWLMSLGANLWNDLSANYLLQYNQDEKTTRRSDLQLTWRPGEHKLLNLRYVNNRISDMRQIDVSGQWPLGNGWYALGRYNYSLEDSRALETLAGVEYNAGCWALRLAAQRYVTDNQKYNTSFFVLLELGGLAGIGMNPLQAIRDSIPGYENTYAQPRF